MAEYLYLIPLYRSSDFLSTDYSRSFAESGGIACRLCIDRAFLCAVLLLFLNSKECPPIPASLNRSFHMDSIGNFHRKYRISS